MCTSLLLAILLVATVAASACDTERDAGASNGSLRGGASDSEDSRPSLPKSVRGVLRPLGEVRADQIEVWVCLVPVRTTAPAYQPAPLRLDLRPPHLAQVFNQHVTPYFTALSNGRYAPRFVAGGRTQLSSIDGPQTCLDQALDGAGDKSTVVLAIANAEHRADVHGGFGTPGESCPSPCPARQSRRGAYVGASDFHPLWGQVPALDLVEHELGHTLGWPHSGDGSSWYASSLDVMSNSAAPRDVDHRLRNAGATLAINRFAAGWIPADDVVVARTDVTTTQPIALRPSTTASGTRLVVLPAGRRRFLTVELLEPTGLNGHLPKAGVAITRVNQSPATCGRPCDPVRRRQTAVSGQPPYDDLLTPWAPPWRGYGWEVRVVLLWNHTAVVSVAECSACG